MPSYDNDLVLTELATGEGSGTWGDTTNVNLELIGEAFSYGTGATFGSDANQTVTINQASHLYRRMFILVTSSTSLSATRTLEINPTTISKMMLIRNSTSGNQSIIIKQGSGATVTIPNGMTKMIILDGAGGGAAVFDVLDYLDLTSNVRQNGVALGSGTVTPSSTDTFTNKTFDANATGNSISNIENADISAAAAIAFSKMANLTTSRALVSDGNGDVSASAVTSTEIGYLDGVTSAIQTQLNNAVTASSSTTFTNKGGNISQWNNNSGYLTSYTSSYSQGSTSGYIRFTNGMQMCWAKVYINSWTPTWTYPLSFPNAVVSLSKHDERTTSSGDGSNYIYSVSNSVARFTTSSNPGYMRVMAIGY